MEAASDAPDFRSPSRCWQVVDLRALVHAKLCTLTLALVLLAGSVAPADARLFNSFMPGVAVGNVIVLNTGTLTSIQNFAGASPAGGSFPTFLVDNNGTRLDAVNGVSAAPEPSTWALLSVGASLVGVATWHRRVSQA